MSAGSKSCDGLDETACTVMETSMLEEESFFNPASSSVAGVNEVVGKKRLASLCRLCANASDYFIPIFEGDGLEHQLDMKIRKHLPIQVLETDNLPAQVCYQCASTLIAWHDLVTACVEADKKLHQIFQDSDYEDQEEKIIEFFNEPPIDSDGGDDEDFSVPSTSAAVVEAKECVPSQKRKPPGKGKQQRKAHLEIATSESDAKGSAVPANSKGSCPGQKEVAESALSTERWHLTQFAPLNQPKYEADCDSFCDIPQWIKMEDDVDLAKIKNFEAVFEVPDRPIFECDHCGKVLSTRENMKIHLRIHTGERPFTCHICGKSFQAPSGFKRHVKEVHEGVKDKRCDICSRAFANRRTLEDHRRIHTGERPFVCAMCGKMFKTKASLYIHNRSHSNVFPFPCTQCNNQFRTQATLSLHILRHTGEKPHTCELCGRGFRVKYELGRHKLIHSENKPFSCEKCGHTFRQKKYLANHNRIHHNDSLDKFVCETLTID